MRATRWNPSADMDIHDLDTPALLLDARKLAANIARMAEIARSGGKSLRPHVKTHKTIEIADMQRKAGAQGITVAKLGEAEVMASAGFDDIFVANQIVGSTKLERLLRLLDRARVIVGVDSLEVALPLSDACTRAGVQCECRVELDTGLDRAGVRSVEAALALTEQIAELPGLRIDGLFTYEGHANAVESVQRRAVCEQAAATLRETACGLAERGIPVSVQSVGSTVGAEYMAAIPSVTELRSGNYVFHDMSQVARGASLDLCALSVLATVISRPSPHVAILDAGTKALSGDKAPSGSAFGRVLEEPDAIFDWANEEHGHLRLPEGGSRLRVGDKVRVVPYHACTTTNMHDEICVVEDDRIIAQWRVAARGAMR